MTSDPNSTVPSFHLLCMNQRDITAFDAARKTFQLPDSINITFHNARLTDLDPAVQFDAIVSPANSYGRMDGGFDDALSKAFSPQDDYLALTRVAQAALYRETRGLIFPGNSLLIKLEGETSLKQNSWGCKYLAFCPTMKVPSDATWDREVVYECIWMLLAVIDRHNRAVRERADGSESEIKSVMMTPLATGVGGWSPEKWAAQTVLAMKHFKAAVENEADWKAMDPARIMHHSMEVEQSWDL